MIQHLFTEKIVIFSANIYFIVHNWCHFFLKGHLSNLNEDPAEGLRLISRGLNINPKDLKALLWAGEAAVTLEDFEEADVHLKRLEKLCGDCTEQQTLLLMIEEHNMV